MRSRVNYNLRVSKPFLALICLPLLMGGACEKKPKNNGDTGAINALDRAGSTQSGPVDETPLQGVDISKLPADKHKTYYKLLGSLTSPCGKGHSLRTSFSTDTACKRAPFAVRYVIALLADENSASDVARYYDNKYGDAKPVKLDVSKAPRVGNDDAPVQLVEFFDYQCPACKHMKPVLDELAKSYEGRLVEYFMMFPLPSHENSRNASQAAVAAQQFGKFNEMHEILFARSPAHSAPAIMGYANQLGIDAAQFEAAYNAAATQVASDIAQGDAAGVEGTPTMFFNGRKYAGPMEPKYMRMWIEEEVAVNR